MSKFRYMYSYSCIIIYIHRYRLFEKEMPGSFVMRSVDLVNVDDAQVAGEFPLIISWLCLKMGYTPNEIAIKSRDNDQQNHWVFWGTQHFQTNGGLNGET